MRRPLIVGISWTAGLTVVAVLVAVGEAVAAVLVAAALLGIGRECRVV